VTSVCDGLHSTVSIAVISDLLPLCIMIETKGKGVPAHAIRAYGAAEVLLHSFVTRFSPRNFLWGSGAVPEAIYNLCLILKIML
jgi:hypothetical protein